MAGPHLENESSRGADPDPPELLMRRVQEGDALALQALVARYSPGLREYVRGFLPMEDDVEDQVQEVFVRVWERRHRWVPRGSVQAYLYQTARNLSLLHLRHRSVRERHASNVRNGSARVPTPDDLAARGELKDALDEALANMPERRREAFRLVRADGLRLREAAEIMGVTKRTVANHLHLALTELGEKLRDFHS